MPLGLNEENNKPMSSEVVTDIHLYDYDQSATGNDSGRKNDMTPFI